jgi:hypothetical protein
MGIPSNSIIFKYTSGGKFIYVTTYEEYQGHYYEFSGKKYAGKEFDINALEIIEKTSDKISSLLKTNNPTLSIYGILSGINLPNSIVSSIPYINDSKPPTYAVASQPQLNSLNNTPYPIPVFYCRKINEGDIKIKEIDEKTYKSLQLNPLYQITYIGLYNNKPQSLDDAEKQLPGLKLFLS